MKTYKLLLTTVVLGLSLGQAMATNLDNPKGLALDSKGNLYVAIQGVTLKALAARFSFTTLVLCSYLTKESVEPG